MFVFDLNGFEASFNQECETLVLHIDESSSLAVSKIAEDIRYDIQRNIGNQTSFDGSTMTALKDSTRKRKGTSIIFQDTGEHFGHGDRGIKKKKIDKNTWEVFVTPDNDTDKILFYLDAGRSPLAGQRRVFGISDRAIQNIHRRLEEMKIG
jgi:hypothetical protein